MHKRRLAPILALVFMCGAAGEVSAQDRFSFYGLEFGMHRTEVEQAFPSLRGDLVREPGHGMLSLELAFDREETLMEIRAAYPRPEGKLKEIGIRRALRERFILPVTENFPEVEATLDEYSNQTAYTVIFISSAIREKNIEFFKEEFLKSLE